MRDFYIEEVKKKEYVLYTSQDKLNVLNWVFFSLSYENSSGIN